MNDVRKRIVSELRKAVKELTGVEVVPNVEHPKDEGYGDYSSNIAMVLFKDERLRINDEGLNSPLELAQKVVEKLNKSSLITNHCNRVEAVRPGFINFWLSKELLISQLNEVIVKGEGFGRMSKLANKKIMLEFADPNPFKEFHIGHLRNISLGESYARLLEAQGANVWRVNYQGDVGLHVAKALYGLFQLCHAEFSSASQILENKILKRVQDDKLSGRIKFLGEAYTFGAKAYNESEEAKKEIQLINTKVYKNDFSNREIWETGRKWSLDYFETIYKRVGTKYKRYYFESEVAEPGIKLVLDHIKDGIFEKSEGAVIFRGEKSGFHTRVFITKEDYPTYEAKDMALAPIKYKDFKYDKSIIITAHEQASYFKVVLAAMKLVSPDLAEKTVHDSFGFVSLKDTKMSSRFGNIVTGEWLLDEAKKRIKSVFGNMDEETAEKVAVGAVKYSMLKFSKESEISFSFDESISLEGNSGPYIQYTFARTQSVLAKAGIKNHESGIMNYEMKNEEVIVLRSLRRFPEVVEEAGEKFAPNILSNYLFDLAQKFNLFYQKHKILDSKKKESRLLLTVAVGKILKNGLMLLGIATPERM